MALDSSSDYDDAKTQYLNNLNWRTDRSACILAMEAIDFMIMFRPTQSSSGGTALSFEKLTDLRSEMKAVIDSGSGNKAPFTRGNMVRP